jgi:2-iminobutanoate/2-iminopropanoate deaminase
LVTTIDAIPFEPDRFSAYGYSPALGIGDLLFVAGQSSIDDSGNTVGVGDFEAQGHQTFRNLARVLAAGGSSLADVVKVTVFVTDMSQIPTIVALRRQYFTAPYPTDSLVEVTALSRPELQIEIEAIAVRNTDRPGLAT